MFKQHHARPIRVTPKTSQLHQSIKKPVHGVSLYPILPSESRSRQPFFRWHHGTLLLFVGTCGPLVECFQGVCSPLCPTWFCLSRHECFVNTFYIVFWLYQNQYGSFTRTVLFILFCHVYVSPELFCSKSGVPREVVKDAQWLWTVFIFRRIDQRNRIALGSNP